MKIRARRMILAVGGMTVVWLVSVVLAASGAKVSTRPSMASFSHASQQRRVVLPISGSHAFTLAGGQSVSQQRPQMSDEIFKNVQVLKGIPVDEFMGTMGLMAAALSFCCTDCHVGAGTDLAKWEVDTPLKRTARRMVQMVAAINRDSFGGRQVVTCWTCHHGRDRPSVTPSLDAWYGSPVSEPDDILVPAQGQPSADQILDKYQQAIGGGQRLASLTSFVGKGTTVGFGGMGGRGQVEIYAKAPDQRAIRIHYPDHPDRGDVNRIFDGRVGWIATPLTVVPEYALAGGELDGARLDAQLSFPGQIKQVLGNWRVSTPATLNNREALVVQGNGPRGLVATLYFDKESGLLLRLQRYGTSPIGRVPTQVDYSDYRDVGGIKMPFRWTFAWLDGRDVFELSDIQLNVPIEEAKFSEPRPPGR
jgi:photosynthetic reaction center cytochrome c subunit